MPIGDDSNRLSFREKTARARALANALMTINAVDLAAVTKFLEGIQIGSLNEAWAAIHSLKDVSESDREGILYAAKNTLWMTQKS